MILQGEQDWGCPQFLTDDFFAHYGPLKLCFRVVKHSEHNFRDDKMRSAIIAAVLQMNRYARSRII